MKQQVTNLSVTLKFITIPTLAFGFICQNLSAQNILTREHTDVGVGFEDGALNLHVHDETNDREFAPGEVTLRINSPSRTTVPGAASFGFLGAPGSSIWILPNVQNPELLFLGIGAEEIEAGQFVGDSLSIRLRRVDGPGAFALYDLDSFGNPTIFMNSRDGISATDSFRVNAGAHGDLNWAFSSPGNYEIDFEASGVLVSGNANLTTGPVTYHFQVVPEPSTWALIGIGLMSIVCRKLSRNSSTQPRISTDRNE